MSFGNDTWAVRIPVYMSHISSESLAQSVEQEFEILQTLQKSGFRWSPRVVAFEKTPHNALDVPYTLCDWLHGKTMTWSKTEPEQQEVRDKTVRQIMDSTLELARCTAYSKARIRQRFMLG